MILKRNKVFFITTTVITLVVCAIILALLINIQAFKPQIEAAASNALGMEVRIKGRLGIALVPGFGISLKDISVWNGEAAVVTVEKMKIGLKLIPLTRHEVRLTRVGVVKPVFTLVRFKNGTFNFEKPGRALLERLLTVKKTFISRGRLVYTDERSGERVEVDDFDGAVGNLSFRGSAGAEPFKNVSFTGNMRCGTIAINNFTLTNIKMRMAGGKGILEIDPVSMDIFGGTGNGSLRVDVTGASPQYRVIAALDRIRIEELIQASTPGENPRKIVEGMVNAAADVTAAGKSATEVKR
ncbi:MAG TPA: AsmA family protein, partial [Nitrospirota bacterium]|nr:AsmA family protein [Nitrospirota bacterium]